MFKKTHIGFTRFIMVTFGVAFFIIFIDLGVNGVSNNLLTQIVPQTTLSAPINLTARRTSSSRIRLDWQYSGTAHSGFKIERTSDNTCASGFVVVESITSKSTRSRSNDIPSNTYAYCYRMRAYSGSGASISYSPYSNLASDVYTYTATITPNSITMARPSNASVSINVNSIASYGSGSEQVYVNSVSGLPSGVTADTVIGNRLIYCVPQPSCVIIMGLHISASASPGTYNIAVNTKNNDSTISRSTIFTLIILSPSPTPIPTPITYTLTTNSSTIYPGQTLIGGITITGTNQVSRVQFSGGDTVVPISDDATYPYSFSVPITTSTVKGAHTFFAEVFDLNGERMTFAGPKYFTVGSLPTPTPQISILVGDRIRPNVPILNIRASASLSSPIVGVVASDNLGTVNSVSIPNEGSNWRILNWSAAINGINGYSIENYLSNISPVAIGQYVRVGVPSLSVKSIPGGQTIVGTVGANTQGIVREGPITPGDMKWWRVEFIGAGIVGWVPEGSSSALNIVQVTPQLSSVCDSNLSTTGGLWTRRWGKWFDATVEPSVHPVCNGSSLSNGKSALIVTSSTNNGVAMEWYKNTPYPNLRTAEVSFMIPSSSFAGWNHLALFPAYRRPITGEPYTVDVLGRIGADIFHDAGNAGRIVIQFQKYTDNLDMNGQPAGCDSSSNNLFNFSPISGGFYAGRWYRLSAQIVQRNDMGLDIAGTLKDLEQSGTPIIAQTSYSAPSTCTPSWYNSQENRWMFGVLDTDPTRTIDTYVDDFAGYPSL